MTSFGDFQPICVIYLTSGESRSVRADGLLLLLKVRGNVGFCLLCYIRQAQFFKVYAFCRVCQIKVVIIITKLHIPRVIQKH